MPPTPVTRTPEWNALMQHRRQIGWTDLRKLFEEDSTRGETLVADAGDLVLDYSKNMVTAETITLLLRDPRHREADRGVHRHARDQDPLAVQNAHVVVPLGGRACRPAVVELVGTVSGPCRGRRRPG